MNKCFFIYFLITTSFAFAAQETIVEASDLTSDNITNTTQQNNEEFTMSNDTVNIGINKKNRDGVVEILNNILANEYILYTKTLNYHWNVFGMQFHDLHEFFKDQYEKLFQNTDDVAERVTTLGGRALGTVKEFLNLAQIKESTTIPVAQDMIQNLLQDHEFVIQLLRNGLVEAQEKYSDAGTSNFLTDLMEKHEKLAWMLRVSLKKGK